MRTRTLIPILLLLPLGISCRSVQGPSLSAGEHLPEQRLSGAVLAAHLRFLASDELRGRGTGSPEIDVAARYLAEQFRMMGVAPAPGTDDYMQTVPLEERRAAGPGMLLLGSDTLGAGGRLLVVAGEPVDRAAPVVFVDYGIVHAESGRDDFAGLDVAGRIVFARAGSPPGQPLLSDAGGSDTKRRAVQDRGGIALVEVYEGVFRGMEIPWERISRFWSRSRWALSDPGLNLPHLVVDASDGHLLSALEAGNLPESSIRSAGRTTLVKPGRNVAAWIPGSDPQFADEVVILMAHYDHVGVGAPSPVDADSIYNGARDNGMGTVALLAAARSLNEVRPRRSVLVLAVTAEEVGLLGSRYYVAHPLIPLRQTVFVLNSDGAGYTDTSLVTVIGLERTTAERHFAEAAALFGMEVAGDPVPEQNLFDRSDNVVFAQAGVPAPTFSPGFREFGPDLQKFYHQPADEADEFFDFHYLHRYTQVFANAARRIADDRERPMWVPGDPYEDVSRALYSFR